MSFMKLFYNLTYSRFRAPWDIGPREELVALVESRHLKPCRVIDLGCGTGANAIYLAQKGFDVTRCGLCRGCYRQSTGPSKRLRRTRGLHRGRPHEVAPRLRSPRLLARLRRAGRFAPSSAPTVPS